MMRYLSFLLFFIIILSHFLMSGHDLNGPFYWDESVYADIAHHPLTTDFYEKTDFYAIGDSIFFRHPPLLMVIQNILLMLPFPEEISFRFASLIFSSLGLLSLFIIGVKLKYPFATLLTCCMLIFHTQFQQYSQSATMYALFFFFSTWVCYGYVFQKNWIQVLAIVGCLYTHYFGFLWLVTLFFLEWRESGFYFSALYWKKYLFILILYLPWIYFMGFAIGLHTSRIHEMNIFRSMVNIFLILGLGTIAIFMCWQRSSKFFILHEKLGFLKNEDRFFMWSLGAIPCLLFLLLLARPYTRYLYPFFPFIFLGAAIFLFNYFERKKIWFSPIFILCLMIPNVFVFGIFPYSSWYYDKNDNPHYHDFREIVRFIHGRSVALTNIRSYYYYYRKFFKELPQKKFPWENIGIHEVKDNTFFGSNMEFVVVRKDELTDAIITASLQGYELEKEFPHFWVFKKKLPLNQLEKTGHHDIEGMDIYRLR